MVNNFAGAFPGGFNGAAMAGLGLGLGDFAMGPGMGFGGVSAGSQASPGQQAGIGLGLSGMNDARGTPMAGAGRPGVGSSAAFGQGFNTFGGGFPGGGGGFLGRGFSGGGAGGGGGGGYPGPASESGFGTRGFMSPATVNRAAKSDPISPSVMFPGTPQTSTHTKISDKFPSNLFPFGGRLSPVSPSTRLSPVSSDTRAVISPAVAQTPSPGVSSASAEQLADAIFSNLGKVRGIMQGENNRARFNAGRYGGVGAEMPRKPVNQPSPLPVGRGR